MRSSTYYDAIEENPHEDDDGKRKNQEFNKLEDDSQKQHEEEKRIKWINGFRELRMQHRLAHAQLR